MLAKVLAIVGGILLLTLILFPRKIPVILRRVGQWLGIVGRVGKELVTDEDVADSPLLRYEVRAGELLVQKYLVQYQLAADENLQSYVRTIGARLSEIARRRQIPYRFLVFESDQPNAFAVPGGAIFVSRSLVDLCAGDENRLAGVVAHEIVHIDRKHAIRNLTREAALRAGFRFLPFARGALLKRLAGGMEQLLTSGYRQDQEFEADLLGARLAHQSGYDSSGLSTLLKTLRERYPEGRSVVSEALGYFSTHPPMRDRIRRLGGR